MSIPEAVIMAAGVGRRLRPFTDTKPKCLIQVGEKTLLERHLAHLSSSGVERTTIVVGHCANQIRQKCGEAYGSMGIRYVDNPEYERGSILSMKAAMDGLERPAVFMDADVLYHPEVLGRLLRSQAPVCFLLDPTASETGEEMMLGIRDGHVRKIARRVGQDWDQMGETVGFVAVREEWLPRLKQILEDFQVRGEVDVEYEDALNVLIQEAPAGLIEVGDLPWTEIDFQEDLVKADRILSDLRRQGVEN